MRTLTGRLLFLLASAALASPAEPDLAVSRALQRAAPAVSHVRVLQRTPVESGLDLVLALGDLEKNPPADEEGAWWWTGHRALGLFLQRQDNPGLIVQVALDHGPPGVDCLARIERVTESEVVISCAPVKFYPGPHRKFVYDRRAKSLVKKLDYQPFAMHRVYRYGDRAILVGSDGRRLLAMEYLPSAAPKFRILDGAEAERWTRRVQTRHKGQDLRVEPEEPKSESFGPHRRFTIARDPEAGWSIADRQGRRFELPQTNFEEFLKARPTLDEHLVQPDKVTLSRAIGPWQISGEALWFGKSFYDAEGNSGVAGFGYFDSARGAFRLFAPPEIVEWSVTALLVESPSVWLALAQFGEWEVTGGGLLRFDRASGKVEKFELRDVVHRILRVRDRLLVTTEFGAAIVEQGKVRRFFVDQTPDREWRVVEALNAPEPP